MFILILLLFIFWGATMLQRVFYWLYLWQVKEYRLDRMRVHFELPTSGKLLLNKRNIWLGALLALSLVPLRPVLILAAIFSLLLYIFFTIRAFQQFQDKSLKLPRPTTRGVTIIFFVAILYAVLTILIFIFFNKLIVAWFLLGDIVIPLFVAMGVAVTYPIFSWAKNSLIKRASKRIKKLKNLLVIGITGSYAKSSVKEIVYALLKENFNVIKTPANINTDIGIARIILHDITEKHDVFIVEMGAYRKGEIKKTAEMVRPQIGILTGINPQHISLFGSLQNIQQAKYELIDALPDKGLAVFSGDNENVLSLFRQSKKPKRLYAINPKIESESQKVLVKSIKTTPEGLEISIHEDGQGDVILKSSLLGLHNATNIIGAVSVARELDVSYSDIKKALLKLNPPPHTLQLKTGIKDSIVIDDAYSANEDGVLAALDVLENMKGGSSSSPAGGFQGRNKKICILQPLIELGDSAERVHKKIAGRIAEVCDYLIMTNRDYFSVIFKEVMDNGMSKDNVFCLPKPQEALRKAQELINKGDIVLVENRVPEVVLNGVILYSNNNE